MRRSRSRQSCCAAAAAGRPRRPAAPLAPGARAPTPQQRPFSYRFNIARLRSRARRWLCFVDCTAALTWACCRSRRGWLRSCWRTCTSGLRRHGRVRAPPKAAHAAQRARTEPVAREALPLVARPRPRRRRLRLLLLLRAARKHVEQPAPRRRRGSGRSLRRLGFLQLRLRVRRGGLVGCRQRRHLSGVHSWPASNGRQAALQLSDQRIEVLGRHGGQARQVAAQAVQVAARRRLVEKAL